VSQEAIDASNAARRAGLGGVARKGASQVVAPTQTRAPERPPPAAWERDEWIDEGDVRSQARGAVSRGAKPARGKTVARDVEGGAPITNLPGDVVADFEAAAGPRDATKLQQRFANARRAYERERYGEARRVLDALARDAPGSAGVQELYGLTLYRLGEYRKAARELEAFRSLSRSADMNAVLADCYRALHRWSAVEELWDELKAASPDPVVMADGRMVMAGALADRGKLDEAIAVLEQGMGRPRKAQPYHLKQWYALADLYERAGDVPRARALFQRVRQVDPTFADVSQRLRNID
jgi:tetratricopeptide (TPR) repeat protein